MNFPVYGTVALVARLTDLLAVTYPSDPDEIAEIHLYQNDASPDINSTLASFVEADFTGYVLKPLTMTSPSLNDQGLVVSKSNLCNWGTAPGVDPQTVHGVFITGHGGAPLIAAQRFDNPQEVGGALPQAISGVWRTSEPLSSLGWIDVEG